MPDMKSDKYSINLNAVLDQVVSECPWHKSSIHGISHWKNVERNALYLAQYEPADVELLYLFSIFHDCKRQNDSWDPQHGQRAAEYILKINSNLLKLSQLRLSTLVYAVRYHTDKIHSHNPTIACCWDADRLDITRVLPRFDLGFFSTDKAKIIAKDNDLSILNEFEYDSIY